MAPKRRTTRLNPGATPTPVTYTHTTTSVTNAQIQAMINEGVTAALAARMQPELGDESHTSGIGFQRPVQVARECTYLDFLKCQPLNFKGTEGVVVAPWSKFANAVPYKEMLIHGGTPMLRPYPEAAHAMPWRNTEKDDEHDKITAQGVFVIPNANKYKPIWPFKVVTARIPQMINTGANQRLVLNVVLGAFSRRLPKMERTTTTRGNQLEMPRPPGKGVCRGAMQGQPRTTISSRYVFTKQPICTILFDTGADRSFVSTSFSSRIVITSNWH
ncbi:putative reverse transcriptase domain-containing protein [Tanacetum coccineum]|uniref:Reverse transcriptase domain-containing protein n=1 Tax=Tanacetum coccineum TaxID=301880 RepID=A0ABQ5AWL1_9ASTR